MEHKIALTLTGGTPSIKIREGKLVNSFNPGRVMSDQVPYIKFYLQKIERNEFNQHSVVLFRFDYGNGYLQWIGGLKQFIINSGEITIEIPTDLNLNLIKVIREWVDLPRY